MDMGGFRWTLVTIVGAALLAIVLGWVTMRDRAGMGGTDRTDEATRELYREEDAAHRNEDNDVP